MSSERELDDGIKSIKSAWRREHTARVNLEKMLQQAGTENAKLRELVRILAYCMSEDRDCDKCVLNDADMPTPRISACDSLPDRIRELGIEVD